MSFTCPVCGFPELRELPRGPDTGGSYEICPSCGFQFGVSDEDQGFSYEQWRQRWIEQGMQWRSHAQPPPPGWDPRRQLQALLESRG